MRLLLLMTMMMVMATFTSAGPVLAPPEYLRESKDGMNSPHRSPKIANSPGGGFKIKCNYSFCRKAWLGKKLKAVGDGLIAAKGSKPEVSEK